MYVIAKHSALRELQIFPSIQMHTALGEPQTIHYIEIHSAPLGELPTIMNYIEIQCPKGTINNS